MEKFTDKIDVSTDISLYEYGIIRNPNNDKCVICANVHELENFETAKPKVKIVYITFEEVLEALQDENDGFYSFIGESKQKVLSELNNNHLTSMILNLEMYSGRFDFCQ